MTHAAARTNHGEHRTARPLPARLIIHNERQAAHRPPKNRFHSARTGPLGGTALASKRAQLHALTGLAVASPRPLRHLHLNRRNVQVPRQAAEGMAEMSAVPLSVSRGL